MTVQILLVVIALILAVVSLVPMADKYPLLAVAVLLVCIAFLVGAGGAKVL